MVLKYSKAKQVPLSSRMTQPLMLAHDIFCYHTMAGYLSSTRRMFLENGYGGTESHLGVGGKWGGDVRENTDGKSEQWVDMRYSADANYLGSRRVISVETADNAVRPIQGWTNKQLDTLIDMGAEICSIGFHRNCPSAWACRKGTKWNGVWVGIPPVAIPDTKLGRRGLAVHRMGCEHSLGVGAVKGFLVPGGVRWSKARGKDCPTDIRVAQFHQIVVPGIQRKLKPALPKPPAPKPPTPNPVPVPAPAPAPIEEDTPMYLIRLEDDPAQFVADLNGPGDIKHLESTDEVRRFKEAGAKQLVLKKSTFLRLYFVPMWEEGLPVTEDSDQ